MSTRIIAAFFSPTGTTKTITTLLAENIARELNCEYLEYDFTLPTVRLEPLIFEGDDIIIFGTPVIAGRVPNILLKYLDTISGNGAIAVPIVLYGNRNYDDALIELRDILESHDCKTIAAGAFVGEHSFSKKLAANRPDEKDIEVATSFSKDIADKIKQLIISKDNTSDTGEVEFDLSITMGDNVHPEQGLSSSETNEAMVDNPANPAGVNDNIQAEPDANSSEICKLEFDHPIEVKGEPYPYRGYYMPRDRQGNHIDIRKVQPLTNEDCNNCGICVKICPMGSISEDDVRTFVGICIKCGACIKKCPQGAKYYDDEGYLYHKTELEEGYTRRAEPELFL